MEWAPHNKIVYFQLLVRSFLQYLAYCSHDAHHDLQWVCNCDCGARFNIWQLFLRKKDRQGQ